MIELREFTKNDWMAFSGAERFKDGSEPLIAEIEGYTLLVDLRRIMVIIDLDTEDYEENYRSISFHQIPKKAIVEFAKLMLEELDKATDGTTAQSILDEEFGL